MKKSKITHLAKYFGHQLSNISSNLVHGPRGSFRDFRVSTPPRKKLSVRNKLTPLTFLMAQDGWIKYTDF